MNTDKITTFAGAAVAGLLALQEALKPSSDPVNWVAVAVAVAVAVWGYFTNKNKTEV